MATLTVGALVPALVLNALGVPCPECPEGVDTAFFGGESFLFPAILELV